MYLRNLFKVVIGLLSLTSVSSCVSDNSCYSFQVGPGTGCAYMCQLCENQLGTTNYYFTDGVCSYESGGCVGSPQVGVVYTCCSVGEEEL